MKAGIRGELFLFDLLDALLPHLDGAVLDIGANVGQTLAKIKLADPERAYFGFEPNAACFYYLENLVQANAWRNVELFPIGLSNRTSILKLHTFLDIPTDSLATFHPDLPPRPAAKRVRYASVFSLNDIDALTGEKIAVAKIDVEGREFEALEGMSACILRDRPVVIVELMQTPELETQHRQSVQLLRSYDYRVFIIQRDRSRHWAGLDPVTDYAYTTNSGCDNYLAVPEELTDLIIGLSPKFHGSV